MIRQYHHLIELFLSFILILVFISFTPDIAQPARVSIEYNSEKLSADVSKEPLQKVLTLLSAKLDITVFLDKTLKAKRISVKFDNLSVEEGIKKLVHPYSTAMIFKKKKDTKGKSVFYIAKLNVYNSINKNPSYEVVGAMKQNIKTRRGIMPKSGKNNQDLENDFKEKKMVIPEERKNPAAAAAMNKKISSSILRSKIAQKSAAVRRLTQEMSNKEKKKMARIQELEQNLNTEDEREKSSIQSKLILLRSDLNSSRMRDSEELKNKKMELELMKKKVINYEQSKSGNDN